MINFLLDTSFTTIGVTIFSIGILITILLFMTIPLYSGTIKMIIQPFILGVFALYLCAFIGGLAFDNAKFFFDEFSKKYQYDDFRDYEKDTIGFLVCYSSDYESQICKNYIEYFTAQKLTEIEESKKKEQKLWQLQQEKMNKENEIKNNIKQILPNKETK